MATQKEIFDIYQSLKFLTEKYASRTKYAKPDFVRSELNRVILRSIKEWHENEQSQRFPIGAYVQLAIRRRLKCFGMVEMLFKRHESIPKYYASKLGSQERLSWERSDVIQELNIKALMTIKAWGRRYREFQHTGRYKPVPLEIFLKTAMLNRLKDFFKYIERQPFTQTMTYATEGGGQKFDIVSYSNELGETIIDFPNTQLVICGEDILQGLGTRQEKAIFMLSFMGHEVRELDKKFAGKIGFVPSEVINRHKLSLSQNQNLRELLSVQMEKITY